MYVSLGGRRTIVTNISCLLDYLQLQVGSNDLKSTSYQG